MKKIIFWLFLLGMSTTPHAEEIRVLAGNIAPFAYKENTKIVGASVELVQEMARRQGKQVTIELVPFARAYQVGKISPKTLILQIARTSARESQFSWIAPLYQEPFMVFVRPDGVVDPDIMAHGAPGAVGVLHNGLGEELARELGITPLDPASDELTNARKLMAGHISAWLASQNTAAVAMRQAGFDPRKLLHGKVLHSYPFYLAAAPGYSTQNATLWVQALEQMKADGTFQKILDKYSLQQ
ncbi:MAG TPA: transporter substrate-binding domain-containing protein [Burkholderiaceae bacterium]|jgi:polar amino acid transport system substrate-binding protein|nr:transporter substrate-binding domain-containing protein [Burkholderiaceae bacterium]